MGKLHASLYLCPWGDNRGGGSSAFNLPKMETFDRFLGVSENRQQTLCDCFDHPQMLFSRAF